MRPQLKYRPKPFSAARPDELYPTSYKINFLDEETQLTHLQIEKLKETIRKEAQKKYFESKNIEELR